MSKNKSSNQLSDQDHHDQSPDSSDGAVNPMAKLEQQVAQLQKQQEESLVQSQRALADYANLKKRFEKERLEIGNYVIESVLTQLLPAIDNLDRAVEYASDQDKKSSLYQGLQMTVQQLDRVFQELGVTSIEVQPDQEFDPHLHEAVDSTAGPQGKIVRQLLKGAKLHDKVIRPAHVAVGNGQSDQSQADTNTA